MGLFKDSLNHSQTDAIEKLFLQGIQELSPQLLLIIYKSIFNFCCPNPTVPKVWVKNLSQPMRRQYLNHLTNQETGATLTVPSFPKSVADILIRSEKYEHQISRGRLVTILHSELCFNYIRTEACWFWLHQNDFICKKLQESYFVHNMKQCNNFPSLVSAQRSWASLH